MSRDLTAEIIAEKLTEARARQDELRNAGPYGRRLADRRVGYWRSRLEELGGTASEPRAGEQTTGEKQYASRT